MSNLSKPPVRRRFPLLRILIGLALLAAVVNLIIAGGQALIRPTSGAPGTLLYATQFQDSADSDWYQYKSASNAQISNSKLLLSMDVRSQGIFSPLNFLLADFDVRVVSQQISGDDPFSLYGILFRYQNPNNYYIFYLESDGAYSVARVLNGDKVDLSARHPLPGAVLGPNHYNDLRVVGSGNQFRFYLNGQLLTLCPKGNDKRATWNGDQCVSNGGQTSQILTDATFSNGKIGLGLYENDQAVAVAFSNFLIYSPQSLP